MLTTILIIIIIGFLLLLAICGFTLFCCLKNLGIVVQVVDVINKIMMKKKMEMLNVNSIEDHFEQ